MHVVPWIKDVMFGGLFRRHKERPTALDVPAREVDVVAVEILEKRTFLSADPSLVAAYTFDHVAGRTVADESGNGHTGTINFGATPTDNGESGSALKFNALYRQAVVVADDASLDLNSALTLSAWINPGKVRAPAVIVEKAKAGTADGYELSLNADGNVVFRLNQASDGNDYQITSTTPYTTDGQTWMNVTATFDGSTMRLYINGVQEASKDADITIGSNKWGLSIGAQHNGSRAFTGEIDDVDLYNRALSADEVAAIAGTGMVITPPAVTPTDPTVPTNPTDPVTGSTGPTDPVTTPTDPTNPVTTPTDPTGPTTPTNPTAPVTTQPLTLLFYGNSFTNGYQKGSGDVHPVPQLVSQIAVAAGYPAPVIKNDAVDAQDLAYALAHFNAKDVSSSLDYVVMQEFSSKPTDISYQSLGDPKDFEADALALYKQVLGANPNAKPILYETWAQSPVDTVNLANFYPKLSATAAANEMQKELRKYYNQAAGVLDSVAGNDVTQVAPVGDAFQSAGYTGLYDKDNHHGSNEGYALSAMVMYDTIYQGDVQGLDLGKMFATLGISASDGAKLQATADAVAGA